MKYEQFRTGMLVNRHGVKGAASQITAIGFYYITAVHPVHGCFRIYPHGCDAWFAVNA